MTARQPGPWYRQEAHWSKSPECLELREGLRPESANAAEVGWSRVKEAAKLQNSGTFDSEDQLRAAIGHFARWIPRYREIGLLVDLTVRDWDIWQDNVPETEAQRALAESRDHARTRKAEWRAEKARLAAEKADLEALAFP